MKKTNLKKFVKIEFYPRHILADPRETLTDQKLMTTSTFIRLDAFMQLDDLERRDVYASEYDRSDNKSPSKTIRFSHCVLSRMVGLGLNGINTDMYITEESYQKIIEALGLY